VWVVWVVHVLFRESTAHTNPPLKITRFHKQSKHAPGQPAVSYAGFSALISADLFLHCSRMSDYDFKPAGSLKLKGVKDKKIKKIKKDKPRKIDSDSSKKESEEPKDQEEHEFIVPKTEAQKRFEEVQRQRVHLLKGEYKLKYLSWKRRSRRMP